MALHGPRPPSMEEWCEKLGVTASDEERMAMLQLVKAKSFEKKDLLTEDEFKAIVEKVLQKTPASTCKPLVNAGIRLDIQGLF